MRVKESPKYEAYRSAKRKEMADVYRNLRKQNPAMARLLFVRMRDATKRMINEILNGSPGGLNDLLEQKETYNWPSIANSGSNNRQN